MGYTVTMEMEDGLQLLTPFKRVGVLGGTFNPIHNGHIDMALKVKMEFGLEKVMLLPTGMPPHKPEDGSLATRQQRLHMAALCAFDHKGDLEVCDAEIKRDGLSYTADTMRELCSRYKETDFYFIIGSDSLFQLETWKDFAELCRMVRFVCVKRDEHDKLSVAAEAARLEAQYRASILVSGYSGLMVSSSYIRKRVAEGKSIADFVPASVEEYIHASRLYQ